MKGIERMVDELETCVAARTPGVRFLVLQLPPHDGWFDWFDWPNFWKFTVSLGILTAFFSKHMAGEENGCAFPMLGLSQQPVV
jgi:hypothetical protein